MIYFPLAERRFSAKLNILNHLEQLMSCDHICTRWQMVFVSKILHTLGGRIFGVT